jgi:hypothetical protein
VLYLTGVDVSDRRKLQDERGLARGVSGLGDAVQMISTTVGAVDTNDVRKSRNLREACERLRAVSPEMFEVVAVLLAAIREQHERFADGTVTDMDKIPFSR